MPTHLDEIVGEVIKHCIAEGIPVDLEGLGTFRRTDTGVAFEPTSGHRRLHARGQAVSSAGESGFQSLA